MNWENRRVVVTGAGGFIGSHLCEWLLGAGAQVLATVHGDEQYHSGYLAQIPEEKAKNLTIRGGDVCDASFVRRCITDGVDTVFHLAAVTSVAYSYSHPEETMATNVTGTLNVCEAARAARVRRFVHTSSAGIYGNAVDGRPITEEHPVRACNPYTAGKIGGDVVAQSYYLSYDLPVATVRPFNAYGPRMGRYLIMPTIITQALEGNEIKLGDLSPTRNFTFIDDMLNAFVRTAEEDTAIGETVHFGSAEVISMGGLAQKIFDVLGKKITILRDESRVRPAKSEIYKVVADCTKGRELLGWQPSVALDEGLALTIRWIASGGYNRA